MFGIPAGGSGGPAKKKIRKKGRFVVKSILNRYIVKYSSNI